MGQAKPPSKSNGNKVGIYKTHLIVFNSKTLSKVLFSSEYFAN